MLKYSFLLIFLILGGLAKAQIPLKEVTVVPTYTAWEVLEKAKEALKKNYDFKYHKYQLNSETIKDGKDTLLFYDEKVTYCFESPNFLSVSFRNSYHPKIKNSDFFKNYDSYFNIIEEHFFESKFNALGRYLSAYFFYDRSKYKVELEKIADNYIVRFDSYYFKGYWIVEGKNFFIKEISMVTNNYNLRMASNDNYNTKITRFLGDYSCDNVVMLKFQTTLDSKILIDEVNSNYIYKNIVLRVFNVDKPNVETNFNAVSKFQLKLIK